MADLLFEIGTEELPSWYVTEGRTALVELMRSRLEGAHLSFEIVHGYATPRRLVVLVEGLAGHSERRSELRRGPSAKVAVDAAGAPSKAAQGFAKSVGIAPEDLEVQETERGAYLFARLEVGGDEAVALLPPMLAEVVADLPAQRKMRWGDVTTAFVRPVAWLLALLDEDPLEVHAAGLASGSVTYGHRFLAPEPIPVSHPERYLEVLRSAWVLADPNERTREMWRMAEAAAAAEGLTVEPDSALREEVTNLVEYPVGLLGGFDAGYLELPEEVLTKVMVYHQRFFPTRAVDSQLANRFVGISNNRVLDDDLVRKGYQQVLAGRLYDARFFWEADLAKSLSQHAWGLSGIRFHRDLGSMAEKVARVGETATAVGDIVSLTVDEREVLAEALPIFRSDLATAMVYEFPELEGVMARAYALEEGMTEAVAEALEGGTFPKGPDDPLPASNVGAVLSVCDRLDKVTGFFAVGQQASGSADPYALRRDANAIARVFNHQGWAAPIVAFIGLAAAALESASVDVPTEIRQDVEVFLWDRIGSLLIEEGIATSVVRAAVADAPSVVTASRRAHLLMALLEHPEFPDLMTLYKRAANLAKEASSAVEVDPSLFDSDHEAPLHGALPDAERSVEKLLAAMRRSLAPWDLGRGPKGTLEGIEAPLQALLELKEPLDSFLDNVLVMVDDDQVRQNRLALLRGVREVLRALGGLEQLAGN